MIGNSVKDDNISVCHIGFGRFQRAEKMKRYTLDWFPELLHSRGIETDQVMATLMVIGLKEECIRDNRVELGRCIETVRIWANEVFNTDVEIDLETMDSTEYDMDIKFVVSIQ